MSNHTNKTVYTHWGSESERASERARKARFCRSTSNKWFLILSNRNLILFSCCSLDYGRLEREDTAKKKENYTFNRKKNYKNSNALQIFAFFSHYFHLFCSFDIRYFSISFFSLIESFVVWFAFFFLFSRVAIKFNFCDSRIHSNIVSKLIYVVKYRE